MWAAGDIASYESRPNGRRIRVEHWDVAFNHGKTAALNMLGQEVEHDVVPYFFSDLADWASLEYVGPAASWDREIVRGSLDDGEFSVWYLGGRPPRGRAVGRALGRPRARAPADRPPRAGSATAPTRSAISAATSRPLGIRGRAPSRRARAIAQIAVTLRAFVRAAGALEATLLLDQGADVPPLVVECPAVGPVLLSEGEEVVQLDADRLAARRCRCPQVRALPPFEVDAVRAEITVAARRRRAPGARRAGAGGRVSRSQRAVGRVRDDRRRHAAEIAARTGDPLVLALGEEQFEMGAGWPSQARRDAPSGWSVQWGLCATSHGWPSGSTKTPE